MTSNEVVAAHVRRTRHSAKFVAVSHSSEFIDAAADLGEGFYTAFLYDERINANLTTSRYGPILINNSYIASFAFNLFLCWMVHHRGAVPHLPLRRLLAHNYKKFFAEQLYRTANRIPARALLLETLLYEQAMMVEVFAALEKIDGLKEATDAATSIMSLALSSHELGHFYLNTRPQQWADALQAEPDTIGLLSQRVRDTESAEFQVEFQCDVYALLGCLGQYEQTSGALFALRVFAFAFASYATMYSLAGSAELTCSLWSESEDQIDFRDISPMPPTMHDTRMAPDTAFIHRAQLMIELCGLMAKKRGLQLFGEDDPFPLPSRILLDSLEYMNTVFDCDDINARNMSNLVAQAMTGHDEGMEYLYLRSKRFRSNRPDEQKIDDLHAKRESGEDSVSAASVDIESPLGIPQSHFVIPQGICILLEAALHLGETRETAPVLPVLLTAADAAGAASPCRERCQACPHPAPRRWGRCPG